MKRIKRICSGYRFLKPMKVCIKIVCKLILRIFRKTIMVAGIFMIGSCLYVMISGMPEQSAIVETSDWGQIMYALLNMFFTVGIVLEAQHLFWNNIWKIDQAKPPLGYAVQVRKDYDAYRKGRREQSCSDQDDPDAPDVKGASGTQKEL